MPHICLVQPTAYPLYYPGGDKKIGGAETRAQRFMQGLAQEDKWRVSVIVDNQRQAPQVINRVHVYPHSGYGYQYYWRDRLRLKIAGKVRRRRRFPYVDILEASPTVLGSMTILGLHELFELYLHPWLVGKRVLSIQSYPIPPAKYRVLDEVAADVYLTFGIHYLSAEVAAWAQARGKPFVLGLAHDWDVLPLFTQPNREYDVLGRAAFLGHYALTRATHILVQNAWQGAQLKALFNRESTLIRNPMPLSPSVPEWGERRDVLWVGRGHPMKQPHLYLELARLLPDISFTLIMGAGDEAISAYVQANRPPNLTHIPHVPPSEISAWYRRAFVLVNTSEAEGMPNTFLEAGAQGTPVASLNVDPDGYLTQSGGGIMTTGSLEQLAAVVRQWHADPQAAQKAGAAHFAYLRQQHNAPERVAELAAVLEEVVKKGGAAPR